MAGSSRARISSIVTEPFDPVYGLESWVEEGDDHSAAPAHPKPGFDPVYPFSPYQGDSGRPAQAGWQAGPDQGLSQRYSPHDDIVSPLSHGQQSGFPETNEFRPLRISSPPGHAVLRDTANQYDPPGNRASTYSIPEAPPPPRYPETNFHDSGFLQPGATPDDMEMQRRQRSQLGVKRQGSIMQRVGTRIMGTVKGNRNSQGWRGGTLRRQQTTKQAGEGVDTDYMELTGKGEDGDEAIGFDVSTFDFGPEFAVPHAAAQAMENKGFDEDYAYTGNGIAVDLSNLTGLDDKFRAGNGFPSVGRAGTIENTANNSYYFPPGRHVPNWKPVVLRTWYLIMLIVLSLGMIVAVEVLFYMSDRGVLRPGKGGLFAYKEVDNLSIVQFAVWKYVPTFIGVVYGILWKVTDEELKRAEPYYQFSKGSAGALAAESLNIEYHTIWSPMVPMSALKYRQYVVAAGSLLSFIASSTVPIFLSVLIRVDPSQKARKNWSAEDNRTKEKRIVVDAVWTRFLEANISIIIALALYVVWKLTRRRSGLQGDPSGIAGIAAMANKSHILMDFYDLDSVSEDVIHKRLNKRTYIMHKGALWQAQVLKESERDHTTPKPMNAHPLLLRVKGMGPFMGFCLLMVILLPIIMYNKTANVVIDKTPWIITGISILVKSIWELLEKEMRMLEPFYILAKGKAPSSVLTLDYSATIPGYIIFKAFFRGHLLLAWVTFVTILIEILTVVLGSLDLEGGEESRLSSSMSFVLAIIIFVIVIATGWLVIYKRRKPFLPRQPGTISSVLAFIHQSRMLVDFEGTEQATTLERKRMLAKLGKDYGFGWYLGRDGKRHLGIDQEKLLAKYKFGVDPGEAVMDTPVGWDSYENHRL